MANDDNDSNETVNCRMEVIDKEQIRNSDNMFQDELMQIETNPMLFEFTNF